MGLQCLGCRWIRSGCPVLYGQRNEHGLAAIPSSRPYCFPSSKFNFSSNLPGAHTHVVIQMSDNTASLVWSTTPPIARAIKALPLELLPALINCAFGAPYTSLEPFLNLLTASPPTSTEVLASELLDLTLTLEQSSYSVDKLPDPLPPSIISVQPGSIATFPLKMSHADTYLGAPKKGKDLRTVLVGDAAHTIHPMAGQGFNMGVGDVRALVDTLEQTIRDGGDVGESPWLYKAHEPGIYCTRADSLSSFRCI